MTFRSCFSFFLPLKLLRCLLFVFVVDMCSVKIEFTSDGILFTYLDYNEQNYFVNALNERSLWKAFIKELWQQCKQLEFRLLSFSKLTARTRSTKR